MCPRNTFTSRATCAVRTTVELACLELKGGVLHSMDAFLSLPSRPAFKLQACLWRCIIVPIASLISLVSSPRALCFAGKRGVCSCEKTCVGCKLKREKPVCFCVVFCLFFFSLNHAAPPFLFYFFWKSQQQIPRCLLPNAAQHCVRHWIIGENERRVFMSSQRRLAAATSDKRSKGENSRHAAVHRFEVPHGAVLNLFLQVSHLPTLFSAFSFPVLLDATSLRSQFNIMK